jgi:hypothetical protein
MREVVVLTFEYVALALCFPLTETDVNQQHDNITPHPPEGNR